MSPEEDDVLKVLAGQTIPPPSDERRKASLFAAEEAFAQNIAKQGQENVVSQRLRGMAGVKALFQPLEIMMTRKNLMRGAAVATVLLFLGGGLLVSQNPYVGAKLGQLTDGAAIQTSAVTFSGIAATDDVAYNDPRASDGPSPSVIVSVAEKVAEEEGRQFKDSISSDGHTDVQIDAMTNPMSLGGASVPTAPASELRTELSKSEVSGEADMAARKMAVPSGAVVSSMTVMPTPQPEVYTGTDKFAGYADQAMQPVAISPVSTFSADVDTASYSVVRAMLANGQLPPRDAVRTEEMVNYFDYNYGTPSSASEPFAPNVVVFPTPWNPSTQLVHIGIKAFEPPTTDRAPANLVLLVDVSGSMQAPNKLPLAKTAFAMLIDKLKPEDTVSIVTYASGDSTLLEPTKVKDKDAILNAIRSLGAGGGTAGGAGIATAYEMAKRNFSKEGTNRILLATDGDFNIGVSDPSQLASMVAAERQSGVFLSVLGFGMGNYNDTLMQAIAQNGNGVAAYIDTLSEARKVLSEQVGATLFTVAKDVKFQIEFNPATVKSYRLLGYETRALRQQDFDNDKVDAGDVGAGHEVTAIYEIEPANVPAYWAKYQATNQIAAEPLRYLHEQNMVMSPEAIKADEIGTLKLRYKAPNSDQSKLSTYNLLGMNVVRADVAKTSDDVRFSTAVAGFSRLLRQSDGIKAGYGFNDVLTLAEGAKGEDKLGYRADFIDLVRSASMLVGNQPKPAEDGGVAFPVPPASR